MITLRPELLRMNSLYKEWDDIYHAAALRAGLSDSAFWVLYTLCSSDGGCLQKDIAESLYASRQTINSTVKKLQGQGLITLEPGKGRELRLFLTEAGAGLAREKVEPFIQKENALYAAIDPEDSAVLLRLTEQVVERYKAAFLSDTKESGGA